MESNTRGPESGREQQGDELGGTPTIQAEGEDRHATAQRERQRHTDAVILSSSRKKIVVAGPGAGKTNLFKTILKDEKKALTLTFVNALVEDLSLDLCGLSEVRTLHSFARSELAKATKRNIRVFPKLAAVIGDDARILLGKDVDFDYLFHNRDDENELVEFYRKRKNYYGHYGFSDIIFGAVQYFDRNEGRIPKYDQVLVDEFQDFNKLEVSLIDLLARRSPILLAGDDDQALYESLKSASPAHIRQRYTDRSTGYAAFVLPYCSRCPRVVVEAFNDVIKAATAAGHLTRRIPKPFHYFDEKEKDKERKAHPLIGYAQVYPRRIPWFIQRQIGRIAEQAQRKFTVLVISPTTTQCKHIAASFKQMGFQAVRFIEKQATEEPTLLDGLKLLLQDKECNLGWRVVAGRILGATDLASLLKKTDQDNPEALFELVDADKKKEVSQMLRILRAVRDRKETDDAVLVEILGRISIDAYGMTKDSLREELAAKTPLVVNPGIRKIPITVTTVPSAKGLDADYVFIAHFDDKYFLKAKDKTQVTDQDICSFLVALTRARKSVFLISSDTTEKPNFLKWIDANRIVQFG